MNQVKVFKPIAVNTFYCNLTCHASLNTIFEGVCRMKKIDSNGPKCLGFSVYTGSPDK